MYLNEVFYLTRWICSATIQEQVTSDGPRRVGIHLEWTRGDPEAVKEVARLYSDVDLLDGEERKAILADVKKFNPRCSFPTVIIGDEVIVGYKEDKIKEALGL